MCAYIMVIIIQITKFKLPIAMESHFAKFIARQSYPLYGIIKTSYEFGDFLLLPIVFRVKYLAPVSCSYHEAALQCHAK